MPVKLIARVHLTTNKWVPSFFQVIKKVVCICLLISLICYRP